LPTQLIKEDKERGYWVHAPAGECERLGASLFDEGQQFIGRPVGASSPLLPGMQMFGPDVYYGRYVSVLEVDGQFDKLEEVSYIETHQ